MSLLSQKTTTYLVLLDKRPLHPLKLLRIPPSLVVIRGRAKVKKVGSDFSEPTSHISTA